MISETQSRKLHTMLGLAGNKDREDKLRYCSSVVGREVSSSNELSFREAALVISTIENALNEPHTEDPA